MKNLHRYLHHWNRQWSIFVAVDHVLSCKLITCDGKSCICDDFLISKGRLSKKFNLARRKIPWFKTFLLKSEWKHIMWEFFISIKVLAIQKMVMFSLKNKCSHWSTFKRIKCINILVEADIEEREYNGSEIGHFRLASQIGKSRFLLSPKELSAEEAHFIYGWFYIRCLSKETPPLLPLDSLLSEIFIFLLAFVWGDKKSEFPFRKWKEMETWYNSSLTDLLPIALSKPVENLRSIDFTKFLPQHWIWQCFRLI